MDTNVAIADQSLVSHGLPTNTDLLTAIESLDTAFAVVCRQTENVLVASQGLQALLPDCVKDVSWRAVVAQEAELLTEFDKTLALTEAKSVSEMIVAGARHTVTFNKISDSQLTVSVKPEQTVAENLHEYMQARDQLFSTSRTISVSEMATTLAHELNTPIGTITNILRGVKMRLKKPDTSIEVINAALDRALEQTKFSQNIISRIRDFTQSRRPKLVVLDVRQQLREAVALLDWLLNHNGCAVELQLSDDALYVSGDATMLQQVLINLLRNAVDAMEHQSTEQRKIIITAQLLNERVTISIADTGHGLQDNGDKLFVPFATSKSGGMGVGLNICRSFIELHQGRLWLSPNDADGCTCFVELPIAAHEELQRRGSV